MLTKDVRILFTGLLRLFQELASHVCVIFFSFLSSYLTHTFSLGCFLLFYVEKHTALLFHLSLTGAQSVEKHTSLHGCHNTAVVPGASGPMNLLMCGFSVVFVAPGVSSGEEKNLK